MTTKMNSNCYVCGNADFNDGEDGFYYCSHCNSQADDFVETGIDEDNICGNPQQVIYSAKHSHRPPNASVDKSISQAKQTQSQLSKLLEDVEDGGDADADAGDGVGPTGPSDFGSVPRNLSYDDYYLEIRSRYVKGFQIMIQLQVKALVEKFNVSPLIVGLAGPIWLRFLAVTRIIADEWADEAIHESESQKQGDENAFTPLPKHRTEPRNMLGQRAVTIWHRSLCHTIPLYYSLAMSYLVCHLARESILPADIIKWALEGKLPYLAAFLEIEAQLGRPSSACPISSSRMFRPTKIISLQTLEALAASIAQKIGLELPPVNFYGIASRFLVQLSIPSNNILRQACRIYEWSMPPELYISANKARLPTRICVMSILIVTVRILYEINGSGKWEMSLSTSRSSSLLANKNVKEPINTTLPTEDAKENLTSLLGNASDDEDFELDTFGLLKILENKYHELRDVHDYSENLSSYLQYCKDVVFAGSGPSFEDHEEEGIIRDLWDFYQNEGVTQVEYLHGRDLPKKKSVAGTNNISRESKVHRDTECNSIPPQDVTECGVHQKDYISRCQNSSHEVQSSFESHRDEAIRQLKLDMEENLFSYIPPRQQIKKMGYIVYKRKRIEGGFVYCSHADYYILLRACARVAQVDLRSLHLGVMNFERRLNQMERRIDRCFHVKAPGNNCDSPANEVEQNPIDNSFGFSKMKL